MAKEKKQNLATTRDKKRADVQRLEQAANQTRSDSPAETLKRAGVFLVHTALQSIQARKDAIEAGGVDPLEAQPYTANDIAAIKAGAALLEPYTDVDGLAAFIIAQNMSEEEER